MSREKSLKAIMRNRVERDIDEGLTRFEGSLALTLADMIYNISRNIEKITHSIEENRLIIIEAGRVEIEVIFEKLHLLEERERLQIEWIEAGRVREENRKETVITIMETLAAIQEIIRELTSCKENFKLLAVSKEIQTLEILEKFSSLDLRLQWAIKNSGYSMEHLESELSIRYDRHNAFQAELFEASAVVEDARATAEPSAAEEEAAAVDKKKPPSCCALQ